MEPAAVDILAIAEWLNTAALVVFIVMFMKGTIIPKAVFDRIIALYERQAQELTDGILRRIDERFDNRDCEAKKQHEEVLKAVGTVPHG